MYIYVLHVDISVYVYMWLYERVYIFIYIYIFIYLHISMNAQWIYTYIYICIYVYMYICIQICIYVFVCICCARVVFHRQFFHSAAALPLTPLNPLFWKNAPDKADVASRQAEDTPGESNVVMESVHRYSILVDDVYDGPLRTFPYPGCPRLPVVQGVREWEGRSEVSEPNCNMVFQVSLKM